jgi:glutaredoxin
MWFAVGVGVVVALLGGYAAVRTLGHLRTEPVARESSRPTPSPTPLATDDVVPTEADHERAVQDEMTHVEIVVYTTSWCPACKKARSWLNENGIAYTERDIDHDRAAHDTLKKISGGTTIPTFDIEGQVHVGLNPAWIRSATRNAAEQRLKQPG